MIGLVISDKFLLVGNWDEKLDEIIIENVKKIDFLECYGQEAVSQLKKCKLAFDPNNILNQGNIINIKGI